MTKKTVSEYLVKGLFIISLLYIIGIYLTYISGSLSFAGKRFNINKEHRIKYSIYVLIYIIVPVLILYTKVFYNNSTKYKKILMIVIFIICITYFNIYKFIVLSYENNIRFLNYDWYILSIPLITLLYVYIDKPIYNTILFDFIKGACVVC